MLDNMSDGRLILGLGRGRRQGGVRRLPSLDGRVAPALRGVAPRCCWAGSRRGYCEYDGAFVKQPRAAIRPAPFKSFRGRTYAAAVSPESLPIMAKLGVGILIIPQKPWHEVAKELETYREHLSPGERGRRAAADLGRLDVLRSRAPSGRARWRAGTSAATTRRVLDHYQFQGDHLATHQGLRVLRQDERQDRSVRNRHRHRLLRESAGVGHARAVLRQDPRHPPADGQQPLRRRVLATRGCRTTRPSATCASSPPR